MLKKASRGLSAPLVIVLISLLFTMSFGTMSSGLTNETPAGVTNYVVGQDFSAANVDMTIADLRLDRIFADASYFDLSIVNDVLPNGNALSIKSKNGSSHFPTVFLDPLLEDKAADAVALVIRMKCPGLVGTNSVLLTDFMFQEHAPDYHTNKTPVIRNGEDRTGWGEMWIYYNVYSEALGNKTEIIFADEVTKKFTRVDLASPYCIPGNFDGWIIIPKSYFKLHPAYEQWKEDGILDFGKGLSVKIEIDAPEVDSVYTVDNIGFTNNVASFLESLGSTAIDADIIINQTTNSILPVSVDDFTFVMTNGKNLTVNVNDDYGLLYSWLFSGTTITTPAEFNPEIIYSTEDAVIDDLTADLKALYLNFTTKGDLPGPATVSAYVGDYFTDNTKLYLYNYDSLTNEFTVVAQDINVASGLISFAITKGADYFLSSELVVLGDDSVASSMTSSSSANSTLSTTSTPSSSSDLSSPSDTESPQSGDSSIWTIIIVLIFCAIPVLIMKQKKNNQLN